MEKGDLVLCVCDFDINNEKLHDMLVGHVNTPKKSRVYTIRKVFNIGNTQTILLDEIFNELVATTEYGLVEIQFQAICFQKIPVADLTELKELL